jgi:transglutaminase-like putative cysteine protease
MIFEIRHTLRYRYSKPVFIEPLTLRLAPRQDAFQRVDAFEVVVEPAPAGQSVVVDLDGLSAMQVWFNGLHGEMTVTVTSRVEVNRENPLNFILPEGAVTLPMSYEPVLAGALGPYLSLMSPGDAGVDQFARRMMDESERDTVGFLTGLCREIHQTHKTIVREEDGPWTPARTLMEKQGACRDFTVLFMDVCRRVGVASRFVSGYVAQPAPDGRRYLHAWAEVYLPGAGWRGFDPSMGSPVGSEHVALAAAAYPELAAPTSGYFRGTGVVSELGYELEIVAR